MLWLGIGLSIIGVALLVLSIVLIKPLLKLSGVFDGLQKTTSTLPDTLNAVTDNIDNVMNTGLSTLEQVNTHLKRLNPLFQTIEEVGNATNKLSASIVEKAYHSETAQKLPGQNFKGLYGLVALVFVLFKSR